MRSMLPVEVRGAAVVLAGTLASFGAALAVEHAAHLRADVVVLAVVLALTFGRRTMTERSRHRATGHPGVALLAVPLVGVLAGQLGSLMTRHEYLGDTLFALAVCGSVWLRRFGPLAARVGSFAAMPFVAMLIVPVPVSLLGGTPTGRQVLWSAVVAVIAVGCATTARELAERAGILPRAELPPAPRSPAPHSPAPQPPAPRPGARAGRRILASDRMAAQLAVALGAAFAVGHAYFGHHWPWPVLTAYILCSPNLGRADVLYRGVLRLAGALAGTVPATLLAGTFAPRDARAVVGIFAVLGLGLWLRTISYAFWAGSVTAALSLLYGYYGEAGTEVLAGRLGGILAGAVIGVAASWLVLPLRTENVLRRRAAAALAALTDLLAAARTEPAAIALHARRFEHAVGELQPLAPPLRAQRVLTRRWREPPYAADTVDALRAAVPPVAAIAAWFAEHPGTPLPRAAAQRRVAVLTAAGAARRALRTDAVRAVPDPPPADGAPEPGLDTALADLHAALAALPAAAA